MSSNLIFNLPPTLETDDVHYYIECIRNNNEILSILFDWSECEEIENVALCLLLNLFSESDRDNITIKHACSESNTFYQSFVHPFISSSITSLGVREYNFGAFSASVDKEEAILSRVMSMQKYLRSFSEMNRLNINQFETIFSELYMNICQHSCATGIVFITVDSEKHILKMIFSDIGVGIHNNIKESFSEYENKLDSEAIQYATKDLITTKSIEQNYGRGLNTLKTSIISLHGFVVIYSGYGKLLIDEKGEILDLNSQYHYGTQIYIQIDFRNFEYDSDTNFTEEVIF